MALHSDAGAVLPLAFCGSKVDATFCLAMISIGGGLESRTSQPCRNNCLTVEMENGARQIFRLAATPHHAASGGGGCRATPWLKTELHAVFALHKKGDDFLIVGPA
jgi:hypothetical protein